MRVERFEAEYLDEGASLLAEVEPGLYHPGVVEDQQTVGRQHVGQVVEVVLLDLALAVDQQLGVVAPGEGELGNAFVGQGIVEILDANILCFLHNLF